MLHHTARKEHDLRYPMIEADPEFKPIDLTTKMNLRRLSSPKEVPPHRVENLALDHRPQHLVRPSTATSRAAPA